MSNVATTGRTIVTLNVNVTLTNWRAGTAAKTEGKPPTITQIAGANKSFQFPFRPLPIQHEGYGPEMNEVERPYDIPIMDVKSGKLRRFSFDAPLTILSDGISKPIDSDFKLLQEMADDAIPVRFIEMPPSISSTNWYIEDLTFNQERMKINGPTTRMSASLSFVEFTPLSSKFVFLQPISYGVPNDKVAKKIVTTGGGSFPPLSGWSGATVENRSQNP